jgi:MATE family multidrug resistance protein
MIQKQKPLWLEILKLAVPLIFSLIGLVLMQFVDALFLAWYSKETLAAVVPAGMAATLVISPFQGTAMFTSTLVAHYVGARRPERAFAATWQGIYFSILGGFIVLLIGFAAEPLFNWVAHSEKIRSLEQRYFAVLCWFSFSTICGSALSGFFSGRGHTAKLAIVQLTGLAANTLLDYCLIFGYWGFPELGIGGAAYATVIAQGLVALILFVLFIRSRQTSGHPWKDRGFELKLFRRLLHFGIPNGLRFAFEMLAWTLFIFFIGRIGDNELAASNIVFRINSFAFFPIIGLGQAVGVLVGQAQGAGNISKTVRLTYTGFYLAEIWMIVIAAILVLFPFNILNLFNGNGVVGTYQPVIALGVILLRFVAVYSLLDACNIIFVSSLQSAGDTRWTMIFSIVSNCSFLGALMVADYLKVSIWFQWTIATIYVMVAAITWLIRFSLGRWKTIRVIEPHPRGIYD